MITTTDPSLRLDRPRPRAANPSRAQPGEPTVADHRHSLPDRLRPARVDRRPAANFGKTILLQNSRQGIHAQIIRRRASTCCWSTSVPKK